MKQLLLVGSSLDHSLSPVMQNAALRAMGLHDEYHYATQEVTPGQLRDIVESISTGKIAGANVTIPYKGLILEYLSRVEPQARLMRSVNTLFREGSLVAGCSTDIVGFLKALDESRINLSGMRVLILGAGGAARAVSFALANATSKLIILNRTANNAKVLSTMIKHQFQVDVEHGSLSDVEDYLSRVDMIVNCTSLGMKGDLEKRTPVPTFASSSSHLTVMDLVYNPRRTLLLRMAREAGCKTIDGVSMLVHQGAESLRIWTGKTPPVSIMRQAVEKSLSHGGVLSLEI